MAMFAGVDRTLGPSIDREWHSWKATCSYIILQLQCRACSCTTAKELMKSPVAQSARALRPTDPPTFLSRAPRRPALPRPLVCRPPQFSQDAPPPRPPPSDDGDDDDEYDNDRYGRGRYDRGGRDRGGYGRGSDPAEAADEAARALGAEAVLAANRARIYRITAAPDQLNPRGGLDVSLTLFAPDQVGT